MKTARLPVARVCALLLVLLLAACAQLPPAADGRPRNVIVLFADGAASTQWEFGRVSSALLRGKPFAATDVVMREGALGLMSTLPADALVTDSAAAATAMSTGHKTNNDMVGVLPDGTPVQTLVEAAKAVGKRTGLVTTTTVYDASPAGFSVHAKSRRDAVSLVDQLLALSPDVLMGGGREYFLPAGTPGSRRKDARDMRAAFRERGYEVVESAGALRDARGARVLGLFADEDLAYAIDRQAAGQPTFAELAAGALRLLSADAPQGFFLFLENENVDSAGHRNDAAALMRDLWAFDDGLRVALEYQRAHPDTLIIVTGDHETGGLSVTNAWRSLDPKARRERFYASRTHLDMLAKIDVSLAEAARLIGRKPNDAAIDRVIAAHFPGFALDDDLRAAIVRQQPLERNFGYITESALSRMVSRQTGIYWGTTGHTAEPAVVGAFGPGAAAFRGYMDNTEFARRLKALLGPQRETAADPR